MFYVYQCDDVISASLTLRPQSALVLFEHDVFKSLWSLIKVYSVQEYYC